MVESRSFYNMLHVHVSLNQCYSLCKKTLCPWTFPKFKWWVWWVKKPFSQNFVPTLPCSPKFSYYTGVRMQKICVAGYERRKICEAKCFICLEWNFDLRYFEEGIQKRQRTSRRVRFISFRLKWSEIPMFQLCAAKRFQPCDSCAFIQWCPYIYMYIYMFIIASYSYRGDSLTWVFRFVSA